MNFTKTSTYAIKVLQYMAKHTDQLLNAKEIHTELKIPHQYLRYIMTELAKYGFINPTRGRSGGFVLSRKPEEISIADIIDAIEGLDKIQKCIIGDTECQFDNFCSLHNFWLETRIEIVNKLKITTLENFLV